MRIVQINGGTKGSTGKIMFGIADIARKHGNEVICVSPITTTNRDKRNQDKFYQIGTFNSRRINVAVSQITGFSGCFSLISTYKLIKKFERFQPNIIHLHNLHDSYINLPMLFKYIKTNNIPTVWTLHDCWAFTGKCPYFTMAKCEKWKNGCYKCPQYKDYPKALYDNTKQMWKLKKKWFTGVHNLTIVTPSEWLAKLVHESYLKEYPVKIINNGIDLNLFRPSGKNRTDVVKKVKEKKYIVLGVAFDWGFRKGLDIFIKLTDILPADKYQIVLVGTSSIIDKELPKSIISVHRTQNQEELVELYTLADVFAMPTREENFPTVNLEALACGTPVVTFDTGGSIEMINEKTGCVVPTNDVNTFANMIRKVCESKDYSEKDCLTKAKEYNMEDKFLEYLTLYESMNNKVENDS